MAGDLALGGDLGGPLNIFFGSKQVVAVKCGTTTLWLQPEITYGPDTDNGLLADLEAWVDEIPILGLWLGAGIGLIGNLITFLIPDGVAATLGKVTNTIRSEGSLDTDNAYIEVVVGSTGYPGLITDVLAHYSEDGTGREGLGFRLVDSTLAMVQRHNSSTTVVQSGGVYKIGDVIRLESNSVAGTGKVNVLYRNGRKVCERDALSLDTGVGYRAVAMSMQAEIETQNGARSNSPYFSRFQAGDLQTKARVGTARISIGVDMPKVVGGEDTDQGDVSSLPGSARFGIGARHLSAVVDNSWLTRRRNERNA
jgi:hypothetical protein